MAKIKIDEADFNKKLQMVLHGIGTDLVDSMKGKLTPKHGKFTGRLQASIRYKIVGNEVLILMEDYGEYLEYGIPHATRPEDLVPWIMAKWGIASIKEATYKAKILARHIELFGTRPYPFIRPTLFNEKDKIIQDNLKSVFQG